MTFHSLAKNAFRTRIYSFQRGGLIGVSSRFPRLFEERIAGHEQDIAANDPRVTGDYGGYLGSALSLYFDHAELGRGRRGWERFQALFAPKWTDPGKVKRCLGEMESVLRRRLDIPSDW